MSEVLLLDGGMGSALIAGGLPPRALPEGWVLARPEAVAAVHRGHAAAGARLLLTCTFNLSGPRLEEHGLGGEVQAIAVAAVRLARGAGPGVRVAGAIGPTALAMPGSRSHPSPAELRARYEGPFRALAAAGADLLWTESNWDLEEARVALSAARATGLAAAATLSPVLTAGKPSLPDGPPLAEALRALQEDGAAAVGLNCTLPGLDLAALSAGLAPGLEIPLVMKPSAGLPGAVIGAEAFAAGIAAAVRAGARWVGGCCGAGPEHLAALARALGPGSPPGARR